MVVVCCGSPYIRGGLSEIFIFQSRVAAQKCGIQNNIQVISCVNSTTVHQTAVLLPLIRDVTTVATVPSAVQKKVQLDARRSCF